VTEVKAMSAKGARTAASGFSSQSSIDTDACMPGFNNGGAESSHFITALMAARAVPAKALTAMSMILIELEVKIVARAYLQAQD
jgi:hypothetical protein